MAEGTTAEDRILDAIINERWHMATTDVQQFVGEPGLRESNSEVMDKLYGSLEELAYRMCGEVSPSEQGEIPDVIDELLDRIESSLKTLGTLSELRRTGKAAAA
jgi:hypothetical protein